ncbi:MAG: DUF1501 domain-containing protein [Boseongicola sp.]|nr:DUF1501 domain-containing protein [Boseongicola sp.]MDD9978186.1 DUF1501 domain-containing protein [Boseongicola sp.]
MTLSRRNFLGRSLAIGCSAAASPLLTPVTFASTPGDARLVVIVLRGAMDGLDVVRPYGDPDYATHRPTLSQTGFDDLDGFFGLHESLAPLMPLWGKGELAFAHAVSTPYRNKRSHFDGQDMLENGAGSSDGQLTDARDGWLNRALAGIPGAHVKTAFAVGRENLLLLSGDAEHSSWSPEAALELSPQGELLLNAIYAQDPLFHDAAMQALELSELTETDGMNARRAGRADALAGFAASRLREDSRIAAFSLTGWDTHANQANALPRALDQLRIAIETLKDGLGPDWDKTLVMGITEFGRTVRENGSRGTDHGTGGAAIFAGGALNGGRVFGDWPGLGQGDLFQDRDLMPSADVRSYAGWALHSLMGLPTSMIERDVFPGLELGRSPGLIS